MLTTSSFLFVNNIPKQVARVSLAAAVLSIVRLCLLFTVIAGLAACGGGGGDSAPAVVKADPIRVNAGANISLDENQSTDITGGSSGGSGAMTYAWQADSSIQITQADSSSPNASLLAPTVVESTDYVVTLQASDSLGNRQSDSFTLTVNPVNLAPVATVTANQIEGYLLREYPVNSLIQLDGSSSTDADAPSEQSPIRQFNWQQIAGPSLLAGIDTTLASIQLTAPILDNSSSAVIRLTVTDQEFANASTDFTITLLGQSETNIDLQVEAARDVFSGEIVVLQGEASSVAPGAAPFTAFWQSSTTAQINDIEAFRTYAISPLVTANTEINYELTARDSFNNSASAQVNAQVYAPITRYINDTGVTKFATNDSIFNAYQQDYAGQDADYGADRQTESGQVIKVGDGDKGFDFTRLDNNGDVIDNPSFGFSCVRDNVTGLIWQVKDNLDSTSINYVDQSFTWYSEDENGNEPGELNAGSTRCNVTNGQCNTEDYLKQINAEGMCGFFDWRLPQANELQSIIHYGKTTPPLVDTVFLPFWGSNNSQPLWYWTSQSSADGVSNDLALTAWAFDMASGNDAFLLKTAEQRVVLVRAGR